MRGPDAYLLLGLSALVGMVAAVLTFAVLRFATATRDHRRRERGGEAALLSGALEEALVKLKAQERATAARADASERLSGEIIASLTSGLLVVGEDRRVKSLNPAGRRLLGVPEGQPVRTLDVIDLGGRLFLNASAGGFTAETSSKVSSDL